VPVSWTVSQNSNGFAWTSEVAPAVQAFGGGDTNTQSGVLAFDPGVITNPMDYSNPQPDGPCYSLQGSTHKHPPASAFTERTHFQDSQFGAKEYDTAAIRAGRIPEHSMVLEPTMAVRRLLPVECEKLQGFPPGFTAITYRGKPAADGPRYRALGNSMAVPVVRWILKRIMGAA
jgi:DNA (cytosine-5)-methyltransferase 1